MSLRSPLGKVLGLGSARGGSGHWFAQRVSAVALVILGLWFIASLVMLGGATHASVLTWLSAPFATAMMLLLIVVAAWHAHLGLQVIVEDYVTDKGTRMIVRVAADFAVLAAALIGALAILRIAFGVSA